MYDAGGGLARAQFIAGAGLGWRGTKVRCSSVGTGQWLIGSQSQRSGWCGSSDDGARGTESGRIPARASWRAVWTVGMGRDRGPVAHAAPAPHAPWERGGMGLWRTATACSVAGARVRPDFTHTRRSPLDSAGRRLMSSSWCLVSGVCWSSMQRCCHSRSFL